MLFASIVIRILDPSSAKVGIERLGYEKGREGRFIQRPTTAIVTGADRQRQDGVALHLSISGVPTSPHC